MGRGVFIAASAALAAIAYACHRASKNIAEDVGRAFADTDERLFWMLGGAALSGVSTERGGGRKGPSAAVTRTKTNDIAHRKSGHSA